VPMFAVASWLFRRRSLRAGLVVAYIEVIVHAAAATAVLGWGTGAHLTPLLALMTSGIGPPALPRRFAIGLGLTGLVAWLVQFAFLQNAAPLHPISSQVSDQFFVSSVLIVVGVSAMIIGALSSAADNAERALRAAQEELSRERARSEALLKQEVSHQVAERSRELGAVLARSDVSFDVRRLTPGERFAGRYRIVASLGAGAMGMVFEVERLTDGERLALKAVVGEVSGSSAARFAREAEIGARIHHAHLVSIVDVGVSSGVPFLVMDLVQGGSLESQRSRFGDAAWALPILRQIAEGLSALHEAGVVHRDLKPANVLLTGDASAPTAKISDFGISRFGSFEEDATIDPNAATVHAGLPASAGLTGTGVILGTPLYMAPEAARGGRSVDAPADVFALGIMAYEMLTGRAPFRVPPVLLAIAQEPMPPVDPIDDDAVSPSLRGLVASCLSGDPARRPRLHVLVAALKPGSLS
jgi:hypothetical protein